MMRIKLKGGFTLSKVSHLTITLIRTIMDNSFENLKTGFSFGRVVKVTEFHGKYEVTYKLADGSTLYITFDESDISHR